MPRDRDTQVSIQRMPNGITAAAARLAGPRAQKRAQKIKNPPWYEMAWTFFNTIGEYRYAVTWVGNLLSRAILTVQKDGKLTTDAEAVDALNALFGGVDGQREMLRMLGVHLSVAGDAYIVGEASGQDADKWDVVAATGMKNKGTEQDPLWEVDKVPLDDPLVIRLWRPHPAKRSDADSPTRSVLGVLEEITGLNAHMKSQINSRLSGAGVWLVPNEMTFGSVRQNVPVDPTDPASVTIDQATGDVDALLVELMETMMEAVGDPSSPAARVPIILAVPGEHVKNSKFITFWTPLDANTKTMRDEAIRRLALGMDMPPEVLTGTAEMNHWNAWQVEEASIKAHTEPLLHIITSSLTESFLWPLLIDGGMDEDEARAYTIGADTSAIRLRPNRSREAQELWEKGELKSAVMLVENGFTSDDAPDKKERIDWFTRKVASGSTTPELVAAALSLLGVAVPESVVVPESEPTEAPSAPSLRQHPDRNIPEQEVDASRGLVLRAMERVGARIRSKYKANIVPGGESQGNSSLYRYANYSDDIVNDLMTGMWDIPAEFETAVPIPALNEYVRYLLRTNRAFSQEDFRSFIRQWSA